MCIPKVVSPRLLHKLVQRSSLRRTSLQPSWLISATQTPLNSGSASPPQPSISAPTSDRRCLPPAFLTQRPATHLAAVARSRDPGSRPYGSAIYHSELPSSPKCRSTAVKTSLAVTSFVNGYRDTRADLTSVSGKLI